ncbi:Os07g0432300 [Oryza sativa Japonica Group]|uniref:Os07g0432300 protein n=1 Tax=Oryza sativa subsp. japonica TaxID=39947 RepID=Q0D6W5_ORYSJ|nr:Os07g0432300 [Oryza sativa Japonica Group]|eukprot:NP_001059494.2 Os07g0432300 [Oryza sativa Japonica Group]
MQQPHCAAVAESTVRLKMTRHMITIEVAEALCDDVDNAQMDRLGMDKVRMAAYLYIMNMVQMATCISCVPGNFKFARFRRWTEGDDFQIHLARTRQMKFS